MNLHEYQAKQLFAGYGIPVPASIVVDDLASAISGCENLPSSRYVVKAQVHAGGRGKAGGVKIVSSQDELAAAVKSMLGKHLVTHQTTAKGQPINQVLIETPCDIKHEFYLGALVNRSRERIIFMASSEGGMDIEEVAANTPDKIHTINIQPAAGLQAYQIRQLAFACGLGNQLKAFSQTMRGLYRLFRDKDLSMIEINPLVVTADGELLAIDGKINIDENALYRQQDIAKWRDATQEDEKEYRAHQFGLNYISLEGNIACMVNGAGLAMATMDLIKLHGGEPANFLDVGGGTTADKVAEAFKIITSDSQVEAILVNIFGGIVRCDLIAEGIIQAAKEVGLSIPVIARLEGTNVDAGKKLLQQSGLDIITATGLTDAAELAVKAVAKVSA